jgi:PAS domain S-box-containing protein
MTTPVEETFTGLHQIARLIADTASDAIITIDDQSTILFVNRGAQKIFGHSQDEMVGQSLTMLMPDYLRHVHRAGVQRYLETGTKHTSWEAVPLPGLHKDGTEISLELSFAEFNEDGKHFFTGIARDITDRKRAEDALKQREEYLRALIENAAEIISVLNPDGKRRYTSPSIERSLGFKPEELIGKDPFELVHPDDALDLRQLFATGLTQPGFIARREVRLRAKDGSWRIHETTGQNLLNDPVVQGIVINSRDITARKRLERRLIAQYKVAKILAESRSLDASATMLLEAICESLGWDLGQFWIIDGESDVLRWLASWRVPAAAPDLEDASRGRTFARGVGLPGRIWEAGESIWIGDLAIDTNFPRGAVAARSGLTSGFGFPIKLREEVSGVMEFFTRDQQIVDPTLLEVMTAIGNQLGQFIERNRIQTERSELYEREQRARLEAEIAMERMRRVQTVTEVALAYLSIDKLLAELLDRVCEAMDVDTVAILLLEEDNKLVTLAAKGLRVDKSIRVPLGAGFAGRVAERKQPMTIDDIDTAELFTPFLRELGVKSLLGVPLLIEGRVVGVIHVGRLTPRPFTDDDVRLLQLVAFRVALAIDNARLFEEERGARREAEAASRAKDEFLTTVSHELRTPLTPIIGWVHMIRNGLLPSSEAAHGLEVIEKNSHALKRLINDLLDMSAILTGKLRMDQSPLALESAIRQAIDTVRPSAAAHDVQLELSFHDWNKEVVTGDQSRLVQAFSNLLDNAIKFSKSGGVVKIICETTDEDALVRIQDAGQGIATEFLPFVFDRFRQEDGSKTRAHGGLGLGLALVKSFIESHHGTVSAESAGHGQGSRFTVRLPRRKHETTPTEQPSKPRVEVISSRPHLMVIEDDPDTLEILRATLEAHGFRVTGYESAAETLREAPENSADLIISDIGMPELDGFELMRELRQLPAYSSVPAIALSGYASQKDAKNALAAGFNAHVSKPVDPAELISMVKSLLEKYQNAKRS